VNLDSLPRQLRPIVWAIDDWNRNYKLGVIFEARVGAGKLMVCAIDLDNNPGPVARQLRRSLLDYMAGDKFQPRVKISLADFNGLYFDTRIMRQLGATALADGSSADEIVDGDPNTFWSSADRRGRGKGFPHDIEITFAAPVAMTGLVIMPRQNQRQHQGDIRGFTVQASPDGVHWRQVAAGELASTFDEQRILFGRTVRAKKLKLIAVSGFGTDHSTALSELAVIEPGLKPTGSHFGTMIYRNARTASPDIDAP
ncbi:MAG: discoidin domain-containing protein, partial [Limisphaerales bacterium]